MRPQGKVGLTQLKEGSGVSGVAGRAPLHEQPVAGCWSGDSTGLSPCGPSHWDAQKGAQRKPPPSSPRLLPLL